MRVQPNQNTLAPSASIDRTQKQADSGFPKSASIGFHRFQLEGLAVAIPWGFESPLPHQPNWIVFDQMKGLLPAFALIESRREEHCTPAGIS
jgi:hypothetical protein